MVGAHSGTDGLQQIAGIGPGLPARSRVIVLIEGEGGTGKELVARALHEASAPGRRK